MVLVVGILGAFQILGGIAVFFWAPTAIQEILGAIMFGMGVIAFALGVLIERADRQLALMQSPRQSPQRRQPATGPDLSALPSTERDRYLQQQEEALRSR